MMEADYYDRDDFDSRHAKRRRYSQRYNNTQPLLNDDRSRGLPTKQELFRDAIYPQNTFIFQDEPRQFMDEAQMHSHRTNSGYSNVQHDRHGHERGSTSFTRSSRRHNNFTDEHGSYMSHPSSLMDNYDRCHPRYERWIEEPEGDGKNAGPEHGFSYMEENDFSVRKRVYVMDNDEGPLMAKRNNPSSSMSEVEREHRHKAHKRRFSSVDRKEYCSPEKNSINNVHENESPVLFPKTSIRKSKNLESQSFASCKDRSIERKLKVKVRMMGKKYLEKLITKKPNEILLTLCSPENGFLQLLDQIGDRKELTTVILIALGNACASDLRQNLIYLVNAVVKNTMFMLCSVQQYLACFHSNNEDLKTQSFEKLITFLGCYNQLLPASACEMLSIILPLLKATCQTIETTHPDLFESAIKEIAQLELQKDNFLGKHSDANVNVASAIEKVQMVQPPENFRTIPILPNDFDIWNDRPFLRPNVINGKYADTEHYLDVQFRLLREDYIRPLRNGIRKYLSLKKNKQSVKKCKDIKIYLNVHIIKQELIKGIPVHLVSFDVAEFCKVNWEFSKRFLSGSLVCLSHDDFQTSYFASVAYRDINKLKDGILTLKFNELSDDVLNFNSDQTFVMIETDAYFEAYKHNLLALQEIEFDKFPLRKYIVDVSKDVGSPAYLNKLSIYDMGPLFKPMEELASKLNFVRSKAVAIRVLNDKQWPTAKEFHLDESQYDAVKAAITKEFTVIQGPPGTGKTYVGLRIVQLLLHNISHWSKTIPETVGVLPQEELLGTIDEWPNMLVDSSKEDDEEEIENINTPLHFIPKEKCPILIVCYTNHALDQFLEGLLLCTKSIVRVGGRCSSDKLQEYQLDVQRKTLQQRREVPRHIFSNLRHKNYELHELGTKMNKLQKKLENCTKKILTTRNLKHCMNLFHYSLLKDHDDASNYHLRYWLNPQNPDQFINEEYSNEPLIPGNTNLTNGKEVSSHLIDSHNNSYVQTWTNENERNYMADVQYLEDMRGITNEDFSDIHIDNWKSANNEDHSANGKKRLQERSRRKFENYVSRKIENIVSMSEDEVNMISDVWVLGHGDRWCLYKYWLSLYIKEKQAKLQVVQQRIRTGYEESTEMKMAESLHLLHRAKIVGMTTTGAAKYRKMVQLLKPKIVIIEEAAEILESHVITALSSSTQHLILIGDHLQLRPNPSVYDLAVKFNLDVSLFERMVKNGISFQQLTIQHRMHPSIASLLVPHIYQNLENHQSVSKYESIRGVSKNLFFVTHNSAENHEYDSKSRVNDYEANFIVCLCRYFILQGYSPSQITVLTTYSGQLFLLKNLTKKNPLLQQVRVTVVDNFQGEENDIILLSFVRSNEEGRIGFLSVMNRVCVALSRAKKGLFAIGNFTLLAEKNELWKNILSSLKQQDAIGAALSLTCQNHPDYTTHVSNGSDFDRVPEGGCMKPCEYRLNCGHICRRMCHIYDSKHEDVDCKKKCDKICDNNHRCPKLCYEVCDVCEIRVKKEIPQCKHEIFLPCHVPPTPDSCTARCEKKLPCGHDCEKLCGEPCISRCYKFITVKLSCGHDREIRCHKVENNDEFLCLCKSECGTELQCGHICSGTCGSCHQGRLHQVCRKQCKRILVCGHECEAKCSANCPPCKKKCENACKHSKCPNKCGFSCIPCKEHCGWFCKHQKCTKKCGELCDRKPCDIPCTRKLKCGHKCIGLCGDPCPKLCAICDPEVKEIFFGNEGEDDARFVQLDDCRHVFEVEGITHWMEMAEERDGEIQMKACPKCKTIIRKSLRFGNIVKTCLSNIQKVKSIITGNVSTNKEKLFALTERLSKIFERAGEHDHFLLPLFNDLKNTKFMDNISIVRIENIIMMMENYVEISKEMYYLRSDCRLFRPSGTVKQIERFTLRTFEFIEHFFSKEHQTASIQQLEELSEEIHRFEQICIFMEFLRHHFFNLQKNKKDVEQIANCLCKLGPFRPSDEKQFREAFVKVNGSAVINVSYNEKKSILKAMGLARGHWYMCPNGHVYCITECGGAMIESKCNECGAAIGGGHHRLLSDNRVATAMDGAQHSAWSETYDNMRNYHEFH